MSNQELQCILHTASDAATSLICSTHPDAWSMARDFFLMISTLPLCLYSAMLPHHTLRVKDVITLQLKVATVNKVKQLALLERALPHMPSLELLDLEPVLSADVNVADK